MHPKYQELLVILEAYISRVNARALLHRAVGESGGSLSRVAPDELRAVGASLRAALGLFVHGSARAEVAERLIRVCGQATSDIGPSTVEILAEADVSRARAEARRLCDALGATGFTAQKVTTIVSELARNIGWRRTTRSSPA